MPPSAAPARRRPRAFRRPDSDPLDGLISESDRAALDPRALDWMRRLLGQAERDDDADRPRAGDPAA